MNGINLANQDQAKRFLEMLEACEFTADNSNVLNAWETKFVHDLRDKFNERESMSDMGLTPWQPSVNQFNTLHGIWSKIK